MHTRFHSAFAHELFKFHNAVTGGEYSEIAAKANAFARMNFGAELTHDDVAGKYVLTAITLDASALTLAVATVA